MNFIGFDMMKKAYFLILFVSLFFFHGAMAQTKYTDLVYPYLSSAKSRWFFFNSACRPFGMVNLSPDTDTRGSWKSGYLYDSRYIHFFSHIHAWQLSGVAVMPTTGEFKGHLGSDVYKSSFSHENEIVKPGYHKVVLKDYGVTAELTSTIRTGFHRYTFPGGSSHILFDAGAFLGHGPKSYAEVWVVDSTTIAGVEIMERTVRRPKNTPVYFYAKLSRPFDDVCTWKDGEVLKPGHIWQNWRISGDTAVGMGFRFDTRAGEQILMKVAISYVSVEQAKINMDMELPAWNFDQTVAESDQQWNDMLSRIQIEGGTNDQQRKFYSDLWRSLLGRRIVSDANGKYMDMTGPYPQVRECTKDRHGNYFPMYNFDAMWGAQWAIDILWGMAYPEIYDGFCNTMVNMYRNGGLIPRGPSGGNYTYVMIGDQASWFLTGAYQKGIRTYDVEAAYEGLRKNAFPGGIRDHGGYEHTPNARRGGMNYYVELGYVPYDKEDINESFHSQASTAMTLEYAFADWCVGQFAKSLGKMDDYRLFQQRAQNFEKVWNAEKGFMMGRYKDGSFERNFDPMERGAFCESNAYVGSFWVPHNLQRLAELMGGNKAAAQRLNKQFEMNVDTKFNRKYVDYGNQPGTHLGPVFNYLGHPWLSL